MEGIYWGGVKDHDCYGREKRDLAATGLTDRLVTSALCRQDYINSGNTGTDEMIETHTQKKTEMGVWRDKEYHLTHNTTKTLLKSNVNFCKYVKYVFHMCFEGNFSWNRIFPLWICILHPMFIYVLLFFCLNMEKVDMHLTYFKWVQTISKMMIQWVPALLSFLSKIGSDLGSDVVHVQNIYCRQWTLWLLD